MNNKSFKAYTNMINDLWESVGKRKWKDYILILIKRIIKLY
jgi:hypothetical protein